MSEMKDFVYQTARMLPAILLLDTSASMFENNKIGAMNSAVRDMLASFKSYSNTIASISIAIITFGGSSARVHLPMTAIDDLDLTAFQDMEAHGMTPMGEAVSIAKTMIEDKEQIPSRAYRPTVVLVSDGMPNDRWEAPMDEFKSDGRSAKCYRMAMGIGVDHGSDPYNVLLRFTGDAEQIFDASDATEIGKFFRYVTMSTTSRIKTADPNHIPSMEEVFSQPESESGEVDDDFPF
mgnify:CR=1 FL=1